MRARSPSEAAEQKVADDYGANNFTSKSPYFFWCCSIEYLLTPDRGPKLSQGFLSYGTTELKSEGQMSPAPIYADESPQQPYLTSPMDTPLSDFLPTPHLECDMLTGPIAIEDDSYADLNLFGGMIDLPTREIPKPPPALPRGAHLHTISPVEPDVDPQQPVSARKRAIASATGTRRKVTPAKLIPLDAPTQKRTYVTESTTSRKDVTTKKRTRGTAFEQDATETIEYRRRQNTVAARRARKRKLEHQQALEAEVEELGRERGMWKRRALHFENLCREAGIVYPPFEPGGEE
jgi:hypothetical protein